MLLSLGIEVWHGRRESNPLDERFGVSPATIASSVYLAENGGLDPQALTGSHSLAKRTDPRPVHLP